ncbi:CTD kinase subunit gamma CTK3-domain-containing protein [Xylariales sp. AK1849]|nr:CTD kinase subunit gamma CTK3-domain-containing protein [Xylariales sp. AK1849]
MARIKFSRKRQDLHRQDSKKAARGPRRGARAFRTPLQHGCLSPVENSGFRSLPAPANHNDVGSSQSYSYSYSNGHSSNETSQDTNHYDPVSNTQAGSHTNNSDKTNNNCYLSPVADIPFRTPSTDCFSDLTVLTEADPAFWSLHNAHNWAQAPSIVEADRRKRDKEERYFRMADPFEVRIRFSSQLQHLNASVVSAQKAAQYALKYGAMSEDLHSCILEQLEKNSMNTRANIMYFIEPFLELAQRDQTKNDYVRRMQRDIIRVVDAVCPEDGSGAANVKVVRKVLQGLNEKSFLSGQTVAEIEELLRERAAASLGDMGLSSPANGDGGSSGAHEGTVRNGSTTGAVDSAQGASAKSTRNGAPPLKLEKRQIEQRIEEDRERHKKRRENVWVTPREGKQRRQKVWDDGSDVGEDDSRMGDEEGDELGDKVGEEERQGNMMNGGHH